MILLSHDNKFYFRLDLLPLGSQHRHWCSYRLSAGTTGESKNYIFEDIDTLFLDMSDDPEIPMLCNGIRHVLEFEGRFLFTPVDEKNFTFRIENKEGLIKIWVDVADKPIDKCLGWPEGLQVNEKSLRIFVDGLLVEYQQMHIKYLMGLKSYEREF